MAALTEKEKRELDATRRENGIKNMYYTRYFLIRYVVAFFFFINLYWIYLRISHTRHGGAELRRGVRVYGMDSYRIGPAVYKEPVTLLLGFGGLSEEELTEGLTVLDELLSGGNEDG